MPQMAPYNWLNLYFMFTMIFMFMISYIYFFPKNILFSSNKMINKINYSWKW